jgi:hypothetical protein
MFHRALEEIYQLFRDAYFLRVQVDEWWRQWAPLKLGSFYKRLHTARSQKGVSFVFATVRTWNVTALQTFIDGGTVRFRVLDSRSGLNYCIQDVIIWHLKICITSLSFKEIVWNFHRQFHTFGKIICCRWQHCTNKMASYTRIGKCLLSKPFTLLVVLLLLWKDSEVESFLFVLHHQETFAYWIIKQSEETRLVYDKRVKGLKIFFFVSVKFVTFGDITWKMF